MFHSQNTKNNKFQPPTSSFHLIQQTNKEINKRVNKYGCCVGWVLGARVCVCVCARVCVCVCVCVCVGDVLGASFPRLIVQMDDLYRGVYLFCGEATSGDLLFPGVAEFFTLLYIPGTIFHPHTPNPQTDLFTSSLPVHAPASNTCIHIATDTYTHAYVLLPADALEHRGPQTHLI